MSAATDAMLHAEAQRQETIEIAIKAGVLERCEIHEEVYDPLNGDYSPAYKLGNYRLSHGLLSVSFTSSRELTDTIKDAIEDSPMECGYCAKWRDD